MACEFIEGEINSVGLSTKVGDLDIVSHALSIQSSNYFRFLNRSSHNKNTKKKHK